MHLFTLCSALILAKGFVQVAAQTGSATLPNVVGPAPTGIGNASDIKTYPICAQVCSNSTDLNLALDASDINAACGAVFRSMTAACEEVTCSPEDYMTTQTLAQQLCGPLYSNNSALSSSVASAIASATAVAGPAASGKNPFDLSSYPQCAQDCSNENNFGGCANHTDASCICKPPASNILGLCERAQCSAADLEITSALSYDLCSDVGGINLTGINMTNTSTVVTSGSPTPMTFTGAASMVAVDRGVYWMVFAVIGGFVGGLAVL